MESRHLPRPTFGHCNGSAHFFFGLRNDVTKRFSSLFPQYEQGAEEGDDQDARKGPSISQHFGWLYILRNISPQILSITGDKSLLDINIIFLFNYMAMELDIQNEEDRIRRQQEMQRGIR